MSVHYFSQNYDEARARFLKAANDISKLRKAEVWTFQVPSQRDNNLFVDHLFLPAQNPKNLLVLMSGVHGPEGFAGSAAQLLFLTEAMPTVSPNTSVLIIHSMNPFGFKYGRRSTEGNVNLNRNFSNSERLYKTKNEGYHKFAHLLQRPQPVSGIRRNKARIYATIISHYLKGASQVALAQALVQGQYEFPQGIEFGGFKAEPQVQHYCEVLARIIPDYENVLQLDFHTGLGDRFELCAIPSDYQEGTHPELFKKTFRLEDDQDIYQHKSGDSAGFYRVYGDSNDILPMLVKPEQKVVSVTMEFGTLGGSLLAKLDSLSRIILENQGHQFGYSNKAVEQKMKRLYAETFFPSEKKWRVTMLEKTRAVFTRVLPRLG